MTFNLRHYSFVLLFMLGLQTAWAQCIPAGVQPVFGTVTAATGTVSFTNVPTGNVIQVNVPAANTQYLLDLCVTNPGVNVPDGTNDGHLTVLSANSATATALTFFEDGCTNIVGNGWGPPVGTWTAPAAGTYFLYLTEWDATDQCNATGANTAYDFAITITAPPSSDLAIDSAYLPSLYTSIAIQQLAPFNVGARVKNQGATAATNVSVSARVRNVTSGTVVSTQTLAGPATLASGATASVSGTAYTAPAVTGVYEFRYICSMTQPDGNTLNDTAFRFVIVDTSLLALDQAILFGDINNALGLNNTPAILGQKYSFTAGTLIDTVFGYFIWDLDNVGDSVQAVIYSTVAGVPTTLLASSPIRTIALADTGGRLIPFVFGPNFVVTPGTTYYIGMKQISTDNMALAYNNENVIAGNGYYAPAPFTTWNPLSTAGFPGSFLIWVNTRCALTASATPTSSTCGQNNGSVALNVTGNNGTPTYTWSNSATTANLTNVGPGTYTVTVNDGGCVTVTQAVLTNTGTGVTITASATNAACGSADGSVSTTVTGGSGTLTYSWSNSAGNVSGISNVSSGTYSVTVTDGTCSASTTAFVGNTGGPTAGATATPVSCNGGANGGATATATGGTPGYTYLWSNSGNTAAISGLTAGSYTVTITDASSCVATAVVTVSQPNAIVPTVTTTPVSCFNGANGSATVSATGGTGNLGYSWTGGGSTTTITNLVAGSYCVTVTDANSCSVSSCQAIANPAQLTATATPTHVTCNGLSNGGAAVTVAGGTGTLTYSWSNSATTTSIANLPAGAYTVTVTDANTCSISAATTLTQPTALTSQIVCTETILGQSTGSATVTAAGGTTPYGYNWSAGGSTTATASALAAGVINVTVTDANNCSTTTNCEVQFTVGIDDVTAGVTAISVFPNPSNGQFTVTMMLNDASGVELSLMDVRGALVSTERITGTSTVTKVFDVTTLAKGIYNLKVTTNLGVVSRKVIVN
jgi:hypothetical protein